MFYPQKLNQKKGNIMVKLAMGMSLAVAVILMVLNRTLTPNVKWAGIANAGIVYVWVTVMYAVQKNMNIAAHVLIQMIAISLLTMYIDYKTGMRGWSIQISIPIMIMIANVTMLILTIVSYKKYIRYAIYQLVICIYSCLPFFFIYKQLLTKTTLSYVATGISFLNFLLTICLCAKEVKEAVIRKFHV